MAFARDPNRPLRQDSVGPAFKAVCPSGRKTAETLPPWMDFSHVEPRKFVLHSTHPIAASPKSIRVDTLLDLNLSVKLPWMHGI
jgi:hypothetical protein